MTDAASDYGGEDYMVSSVVQHTYDVAKEKEVERMRRLDRKELPRVTAYSTATSYKMDPLYKFLLSKQDANGTDPKRIDECIYTPYTPSPSIFHQRSRTGSPSKRRSPEPLTIPNQKDVYFTMIIRILQNS